MSFMVCIIGLISWNVKSRSCWGGDAFGHCRIYGGGT